MVDRIPSEMLAQSGASDAQGLVYSTSLGMWVPKTIDPTTTKGDLIVRGSSVLGRLPVSTDGYVLTLDSTTTLGLKWAAASGGGVTSPGSRFDDPADTLWTSGSLGYDVEFDTDGTSLPSGWAWLNQGTATYKQAFGAGLITDTGANSFRGLERNLPTESSWVAVAKIVPPARSVNFRNAGLYVRDGATGKVTSFNFGDTSGVTAGRSYQVDNWNSGPAYSGNVMQTQAMHGAFYLAIRKNSATSWDFLASVDGLSWANIDLARNITSFTAAPSKIGVNWVTVDATRLAVHWFRVRTALPA